MRLNWKLLAKTAGGLLFMVNTMVIAAQSWADPAFVLGGGSRFWLFVAGAGLGAGLLLLPRPGEAH